MVSLKEKYERNKQLLWFVLVATFVWGMAAHGYMFMHSNFSHDSLNEFNGADGSNYWKIQLGRFLVPLYRAIFCTDLTLPWLKGILSLLWIGLSVFTTVKLFDVTSKPMIVLFAGIFTANITVTATAGTYLGDCDYDMFALLCATVAVYLWRNVHRGGIVGAVLVALSLGLYQSYISVTVTLVIFACIFDLINEKDVKLVFREGFRAIGMLLAGGLLYFVALKIVLAVTDIALSSGAYHSLDNVSALTPGSILYFMFYAYFDFYDHLMNVVIPYPQLLTKGITWILAVASIGVVVYALMNKRVKPLAKALCIVLVGLLPLAMNLTYVLSRGTVHDLMTYAIWLCYLLVLLLTDWLISHIKQIKADAGEKQERLARALKTGCMVLVCVLLFGNVQTSNALYLKKDLEQEAFLSMMTRILYRMEETEGYETGTTKVVFVGNTDVLDDNIPGFEKYTEVIGAWSTAVTDTSTNHRMQHYFDYVLIHPAIMAEDVIWHPMQTDPRAAAMPCYPAEGCIAMIDNVLVVKLGETE